MKNLKIILALFVSATMCTTTIYAADFVLKLAHNGPEPHPFQNGDRTADPRLPTPLAADGREAPPPRQSRRHLRSAIMHCRHVRE